MTRVPDGVEIRDDADQVSSYDAVVLATHPDQALWLLADPTADERSVLGAFDYSVNPTLLHHDTRVLPRAARPGLLELPDARLRLDRRRSRSATTSTGCSGSPRPTRSWSRSTTPARSRPAT